MCQLLRLKNRGVLNLLTNVLKDIWIIGIRRGTN